MEGKRLIGWGVLGALIFTLPIALIGQQIEIHRFSYTLPAIGALAMIKYRLNIDNNKNIAS